jgi:hypothetical protein
MRNFHFRTVTPDGRLIEQSVRAAGDLNEAIDIGLQIAEEIKGREAGGLDCERWLVDIFDAGGHWVMSLPFAMVRRLSKPVEPPPLASHPSGLLSPSSGAG